MRPQNVPINEALAQAAMQVENPTVMQRANSILRYLLTHLKGDIIIWMILILLYLVSALLVYSSTSSISYKLQNGNMEFYLLRHLVMILLGFIVTVYAHRMNYRYYAGLSRVFLFVSVPLLLAVYVFGESVNGAERWLKIPGLGLTFQPSDFAKVALIMFTARNLARKQEVIKSFKKATLPLMLPVFVICIIIFPSNLSTAAILFLSCLLIMFVGRASIKHITLIVMAMLIAASSFIYLAYAVSKVQGIQIARVNTWVKRIQSFSNEEKESDQALKSKIAVSTGGVIGKGPGNSIQKNFLPNPFSDYIFAIIVEEYGIFGSAFCMMLYLVLLYRGIKIVIKSPKAFGALLAVGLCFSLTLQALVNMCVAVGILPVTGLALPLVSMGGTSMLFTSFTFGIILSVSRSIEPNETKDEINTLPV
ncbi:MAG: FtsW/RodA/SpoVE family cell cycle protein [Bacteroidota bacterium]|nr:FtsW/RodA/SpoVE family cell cycle protein [Bacteroidota bacterium]